MASRSRARAACAGAGLGQPGRDQPGRAHAVVPRDHPVVEAEDDVGDGQVVVPRRRQPLEHGSIVVAEVARGAALERRQPGHRGAAAERRSSSRDHDQRVAVDAASTAVRPAAPRSTLPLAADDAHRDRRRGRSSGRADGLSPARERRWRCRGRAVGQVEEAGHDLGRVVRRAQVSTSGAATPAHPVRRAASRPPAALGQLHVLRLDVVRRREVAPGQRALLAVGLAQRDGELGLHAAPVRGRTRGSPRPRRAGRRSPGCRCRARRSRC